MLCYSMFVSPSYLCSLFCNPYIYFKLFTYNCSGSELFPADLADMGGCGSYRPFHIGTATMTKAPYAFIYMPPEAIAPSASNAEKSKYDASIYVLSLGVVTILH